MPLNNCKSQACTCEVLGKFRWCLSPWWFKFSIATEFCSLCSNQNHHFINFLSLFFPVRLYPAESRCSIKCLHVVSFLKWRGEEWDFFFSKCVFANFFSGEECSIRWLSLVLFPSKQKPAESVSLNGVSHVQLNIEHSVSTSVSCG